MSEDNLILSPVGTIQFLAIKNKAKGYRTTDDPIYKVTLLFDESDDPVERAFHAKMAEAGKFGAKYKSDGPGKYHVTLITTKDELSVVDGDNQPIAVEDRPKGRVGITGKAQMIAVEIPYKSDETGEEGTVLRLGGVILHEVDESNCTDGSAPLSVDSIALLRANAKK